MRSTPSAILYTVLLCATCFASDIFMTDAMKAINKGGNDNPDAPASFWTPNVVVTNNATIILLAMAKYWQNGENTFDGNFMSSSTDQGRTWSQLPPIGPPGTSQLLYSSSTDTVFLLGKSINMVDNGTRPESPDSVLYMSKSHDEGKSWTVPEVINQTNPAYAPHYGGSGRTQGIELQRGPHKGRLVVPKIGSKTLDKKGEVHSMVLYSDDQGETWTLGDELPDQWDECTLTEMHNGSVLLSPRIDDPENTDPRKPDPNVTRSHTTRAFARSDDGGVTFAEVWTVYERQPEIYDSACSDGLVYSEHTGKMYWGKPYGVNGTRTNYTLMESDDEGGSWSILEVVTPQGAGYSTLTLLPGAPQGEDLVGVAFQRTLWDPLLEGGGYNIAWATVKV